MNSKLARLESIIGDLGSAVIAFSGGVDSALLASVAHRVLGSRAVAVTAISHIYPRIEIEAAKTLAREIGIRHILLETEELDNTAFVANDLDRCLYCKRELFLKLSRIASDEGLEWVIDGSNHDDLGDYRPGRMAAEELGVRSPLTEAGLGKEDIRALSRELGLSTWDKPSLACLASRIPYGTPITIDLLGRISEAEDYIRSLGVKQVRVRHHGEIARIEAPPEEMALLLQNRSGLVERLRNFGYTYVTLDLEGYRTGSMNEPFT